MQINCMNLSEANRLPLSDLKNVYHLHCNCFVVNVIAGIAWLEAIALVLFLYFIVVLCFAAGFGVCYFIEVKQ